MKMFNRNFILCLFIQFWFMLSFYMTTPQVAQYIVLMGESTALAGFIAGIFSFLALAFRPVSGFAANRFYRKYVLAFGYLISVAGYFGYALAPNAMVVLVFRIVHALGLCIQTTLISVVAMDFMPKGREAEGVGYVLLAATLGLGFGPTVGVALSNALGHQLSFAASGVLMLVTILLLVPLPIEHHEVKARAKSGAGFKISNFISIESLPVAISIFAFSYCAGLTNSMLVLTGDVRGIVGVTVFYLISSVGMMIIRPISGRIVDKKGIGVVMAPAYAAEAIGMVLISLAQSLAPIIVASFCRILGQGVGQASLQGQALKETPPEERGTVNSTLYMGIDTGQGGGAIVGGVLADSLGYSAMWLSGTVAIAIGFAVYLMWSRNRKRN